MKKIGFLLVFLITSSAFAVPVLNRKYDSVVKTLMSLSQKYPQNVSHFQLGVSDSNRAIIGLKVGNGSIHNLVVATHHGNEYGSTELALDFAESIARVPINGQTIFIVPVLNINGYDSRRREEPSATGWHDPNRDYPGPCGTDGPFSLKSTQLLARFIHENDIVTSATIHTYHPAVVFPWGLSSRDLQTPYPDIFQLLANEAVFYSQYETGNSTEVIYPADGTFEDYAYWKYGIWSMLFEVGYSHSPNLNDLNKMVQVNTPGLRRMFEAAPTQRASMHDFKGKCEFAMKLMDMRDE